MLLRGEPGACVKTDRATLGENYMESVEEPLSSYCARGCNVLLKHHFLQSHLKYFTGNMGAVSDNHSERFLEDISRTEKR
jgi:hypothetical protein